jgi:hypothetical protein
MLGGAPTAHAAGTARDVGRLLLQFETAVKWTMTVNGQEVNVVNESWHNDRPGWVTSVQNATTPQQIAQALLALETAMTWDSVQGSWRNDRAGWVSRMGSATTVQQVAQGLLDLETATKWEACQDSWRNDRAAWVTAVTAARGR